MPPEAEMRRGIAAMAENVVALAKAPKGEDYSGPVLFEGVAGAQIFAEVLGRNLAAHPPPGRPTAAAAAVADPANSKDAWARASCPSPSTWWTTPPRPNGAAVRCSAPTRWIAKASSPKPLQLVEKGVLKNYLLTRQPVRGFEGSNGRARLPGSFGASAAGISNLFVSAERRRRRSSELKKKLIELCRTRNKPYGIIVRKMDFPSSAGIDEVRRSWPAQQGGRPVSMPLLVYKVYPDGREELVRGMRFRGFNVRSLKDILAAGDDTNVFEFMDNTAPFALIGGAGFTAEACVIAPSILIDDLELHPVEEELPKLPVVSPPEMTR